MKKFFVEPDMEVITFKKEDIITTSGIEENENTDIGSGGLEE